MPENTTNYKFVKPQLDDTADITATNSNWDAIDTKLKSIEDNIDSVESDISNANNNITTNTNNISTLTTTVNGKQSEITGAATTITSSDLNANRALISNANGKVGVSDITSTELARLGGITSNVQTQLNNKVSKNGDTLNGMLTFANTDEYYIVQKYRTINGTTYGVNVGCGILGGNGVVALEVRKGNSTDSKLLGRLEIGERGVSFLANDGITRTYLTNNGAAIAEMEY